MLLNVWRLSSQVSLALAEGFNVKRETFNVKRYFPSFFAPYFERACLRSETPWQSSTPRTMW